jgi:hypothetical protein
LDAGTFDTVEVNTRLNTVRVGISAATQYTPSARLRIEQPAKIDGVGKFAPSSSLSIEREGFTVPLGSGVTWVELKAN